MYVEQYAKMYVEENTSGKRALDKEGDDGCCDAAGYTRRASREGEGPSKWARLRGASNSQRGWGRFEGVLSGKSARARSFP
jgi:hypothetical protein